jgi:hypothetical protein
MIGPKNTADEFSTAALNRKQTDKVQIYAAVRGESSIAH